MHSWFVETSIVASPNGIDFELKLVHEHDSKFGADYYYLDVSEFRYRAT